MGTPLLQTKLYIPPPRPELVPRPRLIERLNAGLDRKLTLVRAVMHTGDDLPNVSATASMREAVETMSAKRLGMTCVTDENGALAGVLTDGDLRRRMLGVQAPLNGAVAEAMIRSPATISPEALASEALKIMEERKITSLPVVDEHRRLLGVVHLQDLWRTELF